MQDRSKKPGELDELQRLIPGSHAVRIENSGHYVQEEQPEAVAAAMIAEAPNWL
jgi:pimeloyl-ACP methyl ester carboxylesterase